MAKSFSSFKEDRNPTSEKNKLREQIKILRKENITLTKHLDTFNQLRTMFEEIMPAMPEVRYAPVADVNMDKVPTDALLVLTDVHAEEKVNLAAMDGFAEFDWEVCRRRLWHAMLKTIRLSYNKRQEATINKLVVAMLGDMVTGQIHAELTRTNTMQLPIAVVKLGYTLAEMLRHLSQHFLEIEVNCVCGNHGRQDEKPVAKQRVERNWDTAVYLAAMTYLMDNPRIKFNIPLSVCCMFDTAGVSWLAKHGDTIKMSGTHPFYGLVRDTSREHSKRKKTKDFDYVLQGHLHIFGIIEDRILAPSLIGTNEWAFEKLHAAPNPAQLLMFTNEDYGITDFKPIPFTNVSEHNFTQLPF